MKTASDRARKRIADLRSSRADAADSAAGKCNSFTSDAKVVMADGTARPIAEVAIGDEVLSSDPVTGETNGQRVTDLPRTGSADNEQARDLVTVTIDENADGTGDGQITSTAGHAYWTTDTINGDGYWAPSRDLVTGAWLRTSSGTWIQTTATTTHTTQTHTYNLTIANHHTYYVTAGNTDTLVHNCGSGAKHSADNLADSLDDDVVFHYTSEASHEAIMNGNVIKANSKGVAYFTKETLSPAETSNALFMGRGGARGSHLIAFKLPWDVRLAPGSQPNELMHTGSFRFALDDVIYHGTNPFG